MSGGLRLDLDDLVDLSHVIEKVVGRPLTPDESSRLNAAYHEAGAVPSGATLRALCESLQRVDLPQIGTVEPSSSDRILHAAVGCVSRNGVAGMSMRAVAEAAGVSHGSVQHHFGGKAALIAAVDSHILRRFDQALESTAEPSRSGDDGLGDLFLTFVREYPDVVDYLGRALTEGREIGVTMFDELLKVATAEGDKLRAAGLVRDDLDPVWAALNPLIMRLTTIMLRSKIARHIPDPFSTPAQLERWDATVRSFIRNGQGDQGHPR